MGIKSFGLIMVRHVKHNGLVWPLLVILEIMNWPKVGPKCAGSQFRLV